MSYDKQLFQDVQHGGGGLAVVTPRAERRRQARQVARDAWQKNHNGGKTIAVHVGVNSRHYKYINSTRSREVEYRKVNRAGISAFSKATREAMRISKLQRADA